MSGFVITARSIVCSLGLDAEDACAAARAGLSRGQPIEEYSVLSADSPDPTFLVGHPAPLLGRGFEGDARLVRLASACLSRLDPRSLNREWSPDRLGLYVALPNSCRLSMGLGAEDDAAARQSRSSSARLAETFPPDVGKARDLMDRASALAGWPWPLRVVFVSAAGHAGVAEALARACADLAAGRIDAAFVGGVDSLLDEETIDWIKFCGRLKTPRTPIGLQPGEGCGFIVVEACETAERRRAPVLARIAGLRLANDPSSLASDAPPTGKGLIEAIAPLIEVPDGPVAAPLWFVTDLNGESNRALEWGCLLVLLRGRLSYDPAPVAWHPAAAFGDTGCASGVMAIICALAAFARGYAPCPFVFITSTSDGQRRAAVLLTSPDVRMSESKR